MRPETELSNEYRRHSYWLDSVPGPLTARSMLEGDTQADVAIIGAGYTGLWTAWYLKQHAPDLDIAVVEAEIAGYGASGRNGGWCSAYVCGLEQRMDDPATSARAAALQRLMFDAVAEVGRVCETAGIDCHFAHQGHLAVATLPAQRERLHAHVRGMQRRGFGEPDFRWLEAGEIRDRIKVEGALGGFFMPHCAAIHPARLVRGLAEALEQRGVRIFERSAAVSFGSEGVATTAGRVRAGQIILATEGFTGRIPGLERKLIPVHSNMIATEPLDEGDLAAIGLDGRFTWNNGKHMVTYGQLTADRRIAFGHRGAYRYASGIRLRYDTDEPVFRHVAEELFRMFPALRGKRITHAWGGAMGVSRSLFPAVCFDARRGIGWAGGYFGDGVGASHLAGRTLADLVLGRDTERSHALWVNPERERALDQRLWEREPLRWLGIQSRSRWMAWTDWAEARRSPLSGPMNRVLESVFP